MVFLTVTRRFSPVPTLNTADLRKRGGNGSMGTANGRSQDHRDTSPSVARDNDGHRGAGPSASRAAIMGLPAAFRPDSMKQLHKPWLKSTQLCHGSDGAFNRTFPGYYLALGKYFCKELPLGRNSLRLACSPDRRTRKLMAWDAFGRGPSADGFTMETSLESAFPGMKTPADLLFDHAGE